MKVIRFDSVGGASGDMILGALIGLGADLNILNRELAALLPDEDFAITVSPKNAHGICGIAATVKIAVPHAGHRHAQHEHEHDGRSFADIRRLLAASHLSSPVKVLSLKVFSALAAAEGKVHNRPPEEIHFHEVGAVDSIVDIVGSCLALEMLGVQGISVSPLPAGEGVVQCRHGLCPIPAPATVELMKNLRTVMTDEPYELVTPTGAALLSVWPHAAIPAGAQVVGAANSFGQRELKARPNLLRSVLYESSTADCQEESSGGEDAALVLETNIDDCPAEFIGPLFEQLFAAGALDAWTTPIFMKKQRPGIMLSVLCRNDRKQAIGELIFSETTTFGIREYPVSRQCLERRFEQADTSYGKVRIKVGGRNGKTITCSPEMDDCIRLARQSGAAVKDVYLAAVKAFNKP